MDADERRHDLEMIAMIATDMGSRFDCVDVRWAGPGK